jgi:hypothetical protein
MRVGAGSFKLESSSDYDVAGFVLSVFCSVLHAHVRVKHAV